MLIELRKRAFNAWREIESYQAHLERTGRYGAVVSFVGAMRDFNQGRTVTGMMLEHYPAMTEKHLNTIAVQAIEQWRLIDVLILHRIGELNVGDDIVLVAAWAEHRKHAFEACRSLMEELKSRVPFWKKETTADGDKWVEENTPGF